MLSHDALILNEGSRSMQTQPYMCRTVLVFTLVFGVGLVLLPLRGARAQRSEPPPHLLRPPAANQTSLRAIIAQGGKPSSGPSNLVATPLSPFSVKLTWKDNTSTATSFDVYRGVTGDALTIIGGAPADAAVYYDTTVTAGTTYYYKVVEGSGERPSFPALSPRRPTPRSRYCRRLRHSGRRDSRTSTIRKRRFSLPCSARIPPKT